MPGFVGVLSGPDHIHTYVNEAYLAISDRTGFVGKTVRQMFPELEGQGYFELLDQVYSSGNAVVTRAMELRLQGSDEVQFIDFVYQPMRNADGSVTGNLRRRLRSHGGAPGGRGVAHERDSAART
jgi:PAS domain-containing protein